MTGGERERERDDDDDVLPVMYTTLKVNDILEL